MPVIAGTAGSGHAAVVPTSQARHTCVNRVCGRQCGVDGRCWRMGESRVRALLPRGRNEWRSEESGRRLGRDCHGCHRRGRWFGRADNLVLLRAWSFVRVSRAVRRSGGGGFGRTTGHTTRPDLARKTRAPQLVRRIGWPVGGVGRRIRVFRARPTEDSATVWASVQRRRTAP